MNESNRPICSFRMNLSIQGEYYETFSVFICYPNNQQGLKKIYKKDLRTSRSHSV